MLAIPDQLHKKDLQDISKKVSEKFAAAKRKCKILEEDIYLNKLGNIIERDYFPEIKNYRKHVNTGKITTEIKSNATFGDTTFTDLSAIGNDTTRSNDDSVRSSNIVGKIYTDQNTGETSSICTEVTAAPYTLTQFLSKFTSEDNASFEDIIEKAKKVRVSKFPWLYSQENLLALQNSCYPSVELSNALVAQSDKLNLFGFNSSDAIGANKNLVQSTVVFNNTRFSKELQNQDTSLLDKKAMSRVVTKQLSGIEMGKIGADGKETLTASALNAKPILEGKVTKRSRMATFNLIPQTPDVSDATPLMTWGNIENTPLIQDRSDQDDFLTKALPFEPNLNPFMGFSLPDITKKEKLALRMTEKLTRRTREEKLRAAKLQARLLTPKTGTGVGSTTPLTGVFKGGSPHPNFGSSPFSSSPGTPRLRLDKRFKNLSPAASFILKRNKFKVDILNLRGTPRTKTPNRVPSITSSSRRIKAAEAASSATPTPTNRLTENASPYSTSSSRYLTASTTKQQKSFNDLTDNLLKLPSRI